jgi:hypothetical protein
MTLILGIETSCDETGAAVVEDGVRIHSNVVASQIDLHARYGGVFPEVASRAHIEAIAPVVEQALRDAGVTLADIEAIERLPYDHWVTAHNLLDLLRATALHAAQRPALTVLRSPDPEDVGGHWTHGELLLEVQRAANLFRALGLGPEGCVAAFLMPTLPELPALLLGAQVAGVAGSLNYLLKPDAIADLLNAMGATVLVVPARTLDLACWEAAHAVRHRVPTLRHVLVAGGGRPCSGEDLAPLDGIETCAEDALGKPKNCPIATLRSMPVLTIAITCRPPPVLTDTAEVGDVKGSEPPFHDASPLAATVTGPLLQPTS